MKQVFSSNLVGHLEMIPISLLRPHPLFAHPTGCCCADLLVWLVTICNGSCRALLALVSRPPHTCSSQASWAFLTQVSQDSHGPCLPSGRTASKPPASWVWTLPVQGYPAVYLRLTTSTLPGSLPGTLG